MKCPNCDHDTTKTHDPDTTGGQFRDSFTKLRHQNERMVLNRLNGCCPNCGQKISDSPLAREENDSG